MFTKIKAKAIHLIRGENAEEQAYQFLLNHRLTLVSRNFRCKQGEIDLIMNENKTLVFIEVRFRNSDKYGGAAESVTKSKQDRIIAATQMYLAGTKVDCPIRFDVIAISGNGSINWIKNAF